MTRLLRATLPLLLAACPARAPLRPDPTVRPRPAEPPRPCAGEARRTDGRTLTLRDDGTVLSGDAVVLRVAATGVVDARGRPLATGDGGAFRLADASRTLVPGDADVRRDDGLRAQVDPRSGAVSVINPAGEVATAPWTLRCDRGTWSLGLVALLLHDGLERAASPATP
ncbi:MAG: hypothetical protein U0325_09205 [Polyangiales bacterium]